MPVIIFFIVMVVLSPLLLSGNWPFTHEPFRYLILFDHFREAVFQGIIYPRWLPDLYGGYGYPEFVFYQPLFFFFALPFSFLPGYPVLGMMVCVAALLFLGAWGVYLAARELTDKVFAVFPAILFIMTPYVFVDLYVRGDLSELMAMMLMPWPFFFLFAAKRQFTAGKARTKEYFLIAIALALLIAAHPLVTGIFLPVFVIGAVSLMTSLPDGRKTFILLVLLAITGALALSAVYWLPFLQLKGAVAMGRGIEGGWLPINHVVYPSQLFSRFWGFKGSVPGPHDGMSFQLGAPHFILAVVGAWLMSDKVFFRMIFLAYGVLTLMMTSWASFIWKGNTLLDLLQFPWRILSVIALIQVFCCCGWQKLGLSAGRKAIVLSLILFSMLLYYLPVFVPYHRGLSPARALVMLKNERGQDLSSFKTYDIAEFTPLSAEALRDHPRNAEPLMYLLDANRDIPIAAEGKFQIRGAISVINRSKLVINQLYFPGWRVSINGREVDDKVLKASTQPDGRMSVELLPGIQEVRAWYGGPPGQGLIVIFSGCAVCLLAWRMNMLVLARKEPEKDHR